MMNLAEKLVHAYRGFYRAKNSNTNAILRPLSVVSDALMIADQRLFPDETALTQVAYGELSRFWIASVKGWPMGVSRREFQQ